MSSKKFIILSILAILLGIVATVGVTYAFFSISVEQSDTNNFKTSCYDISFTDANVINLTNSYPMSDTSGLRLKPYTFTITNECEVTTAYQVILNIKNTTNNEILSYINYSLDGVNANILSNATKVDLPTGATSSSVTSSYLLETNALSGANTSKTYNLRLWLGEEAGNALMGKKFEAEIMIYNLATMDAPTTLKRVSLTNLVTDASFENGNWEGTLDKTHVKYGNKALKITGSSSSTEVTVTNKTAIALNSDHKYYARYEVYHTGASGSAGIYWPIAEPSFIEGQSLGTANTWNIVGALTTRSTFTSNNYQLRIDYNNSKATTSVWYDGMMIIDLTAAFGAGNEPSKEWCDTNIPFFTGTKGIYYQSIQ